jgi:tetratricopeptide (TPR) repeat protein
MVQTAITIQSHLLTQLPDDAALLSQSGQTLVNLALIEMQEKHWEQAASALRQAIDRQQSALTLIPGELDYEKLLCDHYVHLNTCLQQGNIGQGDQLEQNHRQIVHWSQQIVSRQPTAISYQWTYGNSCQELATLLADSPDHLADATVWAEKAVDCFRQLADEYRTVPAYGHRCGHALSCLASLMQQRGELTQCRTHLQRALSYLEKSVRDAPGNKTYPKCQAVAENNLAWFLVTCTDPQLRDLQLSLQHAQQAVDLNPKEGSHWNTLGVAHYRNGQYEEAVAALTKASELNKGAQMIDLLCLGMAYWQLQDQETAQHWYQEAIRGMDEDASDDAELQPFREEAERLLRATTSPAASELTQE